MVDHRCRLACRERPKLQQERDAVAEVRLRAERLDQFGLAGQRDREQLAVVELIVEQRPQTFEKRRRKRLRLVDEQYCLTSVIRGQSEERAFQRVFSLPDAGLRGDVESERAQNRFEQVGLAVEDGIEDGRDEESLVLQQRFL